jgi:hypothetical protein
VTSTGVLPRKIEEPLYSGEDVETTSSLESAVESLDLPNAD